MHRQLQRLADAGLITVTRVGNQKHYQANPESPIFEELRGLVVKTVGLVQPLREALAPLASRIERAFVFGSAASGGDTAASDLDVLVVSDEVGYAEVYEALQPAEALLGRSINPTVWTLEEWRRELAAKDSFASRIGRRPRLALIGDVDAVA